MKPYMVGTQATRKTISLYEPAQVAQPLGKHLLSVPTTSEAQLSVTRGRAFSVTAPRLWDSLPREDRLAPSASKLTPSCFKGRPLKIVTQVRLSGQTGFELLAPNMFRCGLITIFN